MSAAPGLFQVCSRPRRVFGLVGDPRRRRAAGSSRGDGARLARSLSAAARRALLGSGWHAAVGPPSCGVTFTVAIKQTCRSGGRWLRRRAAGTSPSFSSFQVRLPRQAGGGLNERPFLRWMKPRLRKGCKYGSGNGSSWGFLLSMVEAPSLLVL